MVAVQWQHSVSASDRRELAHHIERSAPGELAMITARVLADAMLMAQSGVLYTRYGDLQWEQDNGRIHYTWA